MKDFIDWSYVDLDNLEWAMDFSTEHIWYPIKSWCHYPITSYILSLWYVCVIRVSRGKIQTDVLHEWHWWKWFLIKRRICQDAQVWSVFLFFIPVCLFFCLKVHLHLFDVLQVFYWSLQLCSVKEPGRGRHQGHDAGRRLWWQGENHMGGLPFPPAGSWEGATVCPTQCQRLEKVLPKKIFFCKILISLTLFDKLAPLLCV